ncbi:MAG: hypothetical protein QM775_08350 [Pirellulales bacterium]
MPHAYLLRARRCAVAALLSLLIAFAAAAWFDVAPLRTANNSASSKPAANVAATKPSLSTEIDRLIAAERLRLPARRPTTANFCAA